MPSLEDLNLNKFLQRSSGELTGDNYTPENVSGVSGGYSESDPSSITSGELLGDLIMVDGFIRSKNYVPLTAGWTINADGTSQFFDITLIGGTFKFGKTSFTDAVNAGYIIDSNGIYLGSAGDATSLKYTISTGALSLTGGSITGGSIAIGSGNNIFKADSNGIYLGNATFASAPFKVSMTGDLTATSATITGAITAAAGSVIATTYLSGAVGLLNTNIAAQGWTNTCIFSATDYRIVAWSAGVITTAAGTAYNINAGNTGNMAALTYIYLDIAVSTTVLQITTTAATAIGSGKILIGTAQNNSDTTSKAQYQIFGGSGGQRIFVDNISANLASTNEFISNSAQIANLVVTSAKINDLAANKITAGTGIINSLSVLSTLTMGSALTDGIIQSYGWDGSVNGFQIKGGATPSATLIGGTITGGIIQTSTSGQRVVLDSTGLIGYDSSGIINTYLNNSNLNTYNLWLVNNNNKDFILMSNLAENINISGDSIRMLCGSFITNSNNYTENYNNLYLFRGYVQINPTITKTGTGSITMTADGSYTAISSKSYKIEIDGVGNPNTFKWSDDGGATWDVTGVSITGSAQVLNNGVQITFSAITGGVSGDYWTFDTGAITSYGGNFISLRNVPTTSSAIMIDISNDGTGKDIDGTNSNWYATPTGILAANELRAIGDIGGSASANSITNVYDISANSTGVGSIKFKGTTSRDSVGFIKIYIGTTAYYIPVFDSITG